MNFKKFRMLLIVVFMLVSVIPLVSLGYKVISQGETSDRGKSIFLPQCLAAFKLLNENGLCDYNTFSSLKVYTELFILFNILNNYAVIKNSG